MRVLLIQKLSCCRSSHSQTNQTINIYKCAMNVRFCSIVSQLRTLIDLGHVGHTLNKFHLLSQHVADLHCKA